MSRGPKKDSLISLRVAKTLLDEVDARAKTLNTNRNQYFENAVDFVKDRRDFMPHSQPPIFRADEDGPLVLFQSLDGTEEIGVRVCRNRVFPMFIIFDMRDGGRPFPDRSLLGIHPLLDELMTDFISGTKRNYSWDTLFYREMCAKLGLDPDWQRPRFLDKVRKTATKLVDEVAIRKGWGDPAEGIWKSFLMDVIDLLRTDINPDYFLLKSVARNLPRHENREPLISEVRQALELVKGARTYKSAVTDIRFLPSSAGVGYLASVRGWEKGCEPDGWQREWGEAVKGVALMPHFDWSDPLAQIVRRGFEKEGVVFLTANQAKRYMQNEGSYWVWQHGYCAGYSSDPDGIEPREPTRWERLAWRVRKPPTPISDRSNAPRH